MTLIVLLYDPKLPPHLGDRLIGNGSTLKDIARWGAEGIGQGNVTAWEFYQVLKNPKFFNKTTFYLNRKPFSDVSRELVD